MIPYDQMRNTKVVDMSALAQFSLLITDILVWEIFTGGMMPYDQMRNAEVVAQFSLLITGVLVWEIFTGGMMPYDQMRNAEVVDFVCCSSVLSLDYRCINVGDIYWWYDAV